MHVVPRWSGDANFITIIGGTKVVPQLLRETRELLADGMGQPAVSDFYLMTRAAYAKLSTPVAKVGAAGGLHPRHHHDHRHRGLGARRADAVPDRAAVVGLRSRCSSSCWPTCSTVRWPAQRGGGTRFGAVLDATCDRISDGAIFCGLLWWAAFGLHSTSLVVATMICLVTSQVISYVKARAEASGLQRRAAGSSSDPNGWSSCWSARGCPDVPFLHVPWLLHVAMWLLAVASLVTLGQRRAHRADLAGRDGPTAEGPTAAAGDRRRRAVTTTPAGPQDGRAAAASRSGARLADLGYAAGWRVVRAMPEFVARNAFDAGAIYAARGGGPEQLRKNLARVLGVTPAEVPDGLIRASLASYARYWREAFRLPSMDQDEARARGSTPCLSGSEHVAAALDAGRGAIMALPHSGNWDMAGVWLVQHYGTFTTVAERLKPESLYQPVHRLPGEPRLRGAAADRRRAAAVRGARRAAARQRDRLPDGRPRPDPVRRAGRLLRRADPDARRPGEAGDRDRCGRCCRRTATTRATAGCSTCRRAAGHVLGRRRRDHAGDGRPVRQGHRRPSRGLAHAAAAVAGRSVRGAARQDSRGDA